MIAAEWEDMRRTNSPRDIFIRYAHYFQLNLDETCFLCNEGELKIIGDNNKPRHDKNGSDSRFSVTVLRVGSEAGVNGTVIFLAKVTKVQTRLRGKKLGDQIWIARRILCDSKQSSIYGRQDLGEGGESVSPWY